MIFAIIDYLKYRFNKGIYSEESIKKEHAYLANENCLPFLESCKPLDVLLVHTKKSFLSWLVMYYTGPTIWSHVTTFGHNGYIYDTTTKGVTKHHVSDYFDGNTYIAVMQSERMSEEERRAGLFRAETLVGHKFNWLGVLIFWLMIILGKEEEYRFRYSLDIIILLTFLSMLSSRFVTIQLCVNGLMFIYISIVIFNRLFSKVRSNAVL